MRDYLISFFEEFEYKKKDAEYLLGAYDKIALCDGASTLLSQAIAAHDADHLIDYKEEVLNRSKQISDLTGIHPYTTDLLVFICLMKRLKERYVENGIDLQIYHDSVLDLKWKIEECKMVKGVCGSFVASWFPGFCKLERFALGRLHFEIITAGFDYDKNGFHIEKDKTQLINVHIPRTGTPMDKESCDNAYAMAREFFKEQLGEKPIFHCNSWLLFPENKQILPSHTNTYHFLSEYEIVEWSYTVGQDLWRLFDTDEKNPDRLPTNGSLRRCYVEHLKKGGRVGRGRGVKF